MRALQRSETFSHNTFRAFAAILLERTGVQTYLLNILLILGSRAIQHHGLQRTKSAEGYGTTDCILFM